MKKNIPLLKRLRTRFLRMRHAAHFNMEDVAQKTDCGTAMCIAGHTLDLEGYKRKFNDNYLEFDWFTPSGREVYDVLGEAERLLGLTEGEAVFEDPNGNQRNNGLFFRFDLKTPKQAARVIEKVISESATE